MNLAANVALCLVSLAPWAGAVDVANSEIYCINSFAKPSKGASCGGVFGAIGLKR